MIKAIIGKKMNMTQVFDGHGRSVPVTLVLASANLVTAIKDKDTDGYKAVQIGFGASKKISKPLQGHLKKATGKLGYFPTAIREVEFDDDVKVGQQLKASDIFSKGSMVDVIGVSKGKGFAGVVKRHGFKGGPKTHGQSDRHRAPGSIGATTTPGRVFKGLRMAGHMGTETVTVQGLEIVKIDDESETILIKGAIPGPRGSVILLTKSKKKRKKYHEPVIQNISLGDDSEDKEKEVSQEGAENTTENKEPVVEAAGEQVAEKVDGDQNGGN